MSADLIHFFTVNWFGQFIVMLAECLLVTVPLLVAVAYMTYVDRKVWASIQLRRGEPERARNAFQKALEIRPFRSAIRDGLGDSNERLGNKQRAIEERVEPIDRRDVREQHREAADAEDRDQRDDEVADEPRARQRLHQCPPAISAPTRPRSTLARSNAPTKRPPGRSFGNIWNSMQTCKWWPNAPMASKR